MMLSRIRRGALALAMLSPLVAFADRDARAGVVVTRIGDPTFTPVDFHLFAAPIGTAASGYAEFAQTAEAILPPPDHLPDPVLFIGPGAPHVGPYDQEIGDGVAANGFVESSTFSTGQFSYGMGVWLAFMVVPGPNSPTGSSPDFASGPILPNAIFPLSVDGDTFTDGSINNDFLAAFNVPALGQLPGGAGLDGYSHIPFFFADNFDFVTRRVTGGYEYRVTVLDAAGNGYQINASFQVVPEPSSVVMLGGGSALVALGYLGRSRRARHA
ncbi:PEP-CTERM sorting domain-containing protein [Paludisphaera sp.]|uniref:PEP-CTERM sorting domain-containing protein n=1 Tax=Paludisphaera sp. TaxID=2017432 RepID=UPI00301D93E9